MLGYHCVLLMVKAVVVLLSCVRLFVLLLIVKAVVVLLSRDVRLRLCIV